MGRGEIHYKHLNTKWSSEKEAIRFRPEISTQAIGETLASYLCVDISQGIMTKSILKEISPEYSLEGLMLKLKLKLQYFGHLMRRTDSLEKTLMLGKMEDRGWDGWMASPTQWTCVWASFGSWWWTGKPGVLQSMGSQRVGHDWATELNWTESLSGFWKLKMWSLGY